MVDIVADEQVPRELSGNKNGDKKAVAWGDTLIVYTLKSDG